MAVNIYAKVFCCLFLVLQQEIERAANNKLRFSDCESGVYHIISLCRRIVQRYKMQFVKMAKSVADCR